MKIFLITLIAGLFLSATAVEADTKSFTGTIKPFLNKYCVDCHDDEVQKGDVSLHNLDDVNLNNVQLWKQVWEQVALKEMPPRKKKNQPELMERYHVSQWITAKLEIALKPKGGFTEHKRPIKGNHLDHDLLFNTTHTNLEPASTPARIWRIHPQEHLVRLNELIAKEPAYNPKFPGARTRGDHIPANQSGQVKVYFGLERFLGQVGGSESYANKVKGFPAILSIVRDHGLRNYPFLYTVNSAEANQLSSVAEEILRFMAYGPDEEPYKFAKSMKEIPEKYKDKKAQLAGGNVFYHKDPKRPLTPVYELIKNKKFTDEAIRKAVNFLFEALTLRPPAKEESDEYLLTVRESIKDLGNEDGAILGLTTIFLDRDALFRSELCHQGKPDKYGRVMLQGNELMLAVNAAFSYIQPDPKLRQALAKGKLKTREDVKREVTRILNDDSIRKPRLLQFFREYFDYDLAPAVCKDGKAFREAGGERFYEQLLNQAVAWVDRMIELILKEDKDVLKELLTTDRMVLDESFATYLFNIDTDIKLVSQEEMSKFSKEQVKKHRQINSKKKAAALKRIFRNIRGRIAVRESKFDLKKYRVVPATVNKSERMGILTHPTWLIAHSDAMDNHAILRGRWIRERLLGDAVPDVPITVDAMLPDEPGTTLRHRMRVTREKDCWRCHQKMDPLGMPFEMYNHIGLRRNKECGKPVDTTGHIYFSGEQKLDGPVKDALDMIKKLSESERVTQVFVRHVFRYWMGRNETINDAPVLQEAYKVYKESGGSMKALLKSLLTSDAFLYRKVHSKQ